MAVPVRKATLAVAAMLVAGLAQAAPAQESLGPVTQLPLPRFVSLKSSEGNVRRGPSLGHRIDWVYRLEDLPLQITAEYGHWRRVEDRDGLGGWMHYALLSGVRTVLIEEEEVALLMKPVDGSPENARLRRGVVARVEECGADWCQLRAGGYSGWTRKAALWGVEPGEIIE